MAEVFLDFETRSEVDIEEVGTDAYCRHPSTEVLGLGWKVGLHGKKKKWIPKNRRSTEDMPPELMALLLDPENLLIAWFVPFERNIFWRVLGLWLDYRRWRDVMILALSQSLPGKLEKVCDILKLAAEDRKADGDDLIRFFSISVPKRQKRYTLFGEESVFNEPERFPEKFEKFMEYMLQDVHAEAVLWYRLNASPLPDDIWEEWFLDQAMNDIGMPVNRQMVENALWLAKEDKRIKKERLIEITGLENPLSDAQIKPWLKERGYSWGTILKGYVEMELRNPQSKLTPEAREVLKLRQAASQRSWTKLQRILDMLSPDDRLRYQFRFLAAGRTGRDAGGGVQPQNLPRPDKTVKKNFTRAVELIMARDYDTIQKEYPSVIGMVVSSIRMAFQAPDGYEMDVCDLNAIENRGLGYLARCPAILNVFKMGRCPYLSFGVYLYEPMTYEQLEAEYKSGKDEKRQNSKPGVLGGGYGLGGGELFITEFGDEVWGGLMGYARNVCGIEMPKDLAHKAVKILRKAWPEVVQYWKDLEEGFKSVLRTGKPIEIGRVTYRKIDDDGEDVTGQQGKYGRWKWVPCKDVVEGAVLVIDRKKIKGGGYMIRIKLPSGRCLHYLNCTIEEVTAKGQDGRPWIQEQIYYDGIEHSATQEADGSRAKKKHKWGRVKTYGGKLCENVVQAFCRDVFFYCFRLAVGLGFEVFGRFHDEMAALRWKNDFGLSLADFRWAMSQPPPSSPDFINGAEGFTTPFYRKG